LIGSPKDPVSGTFVSWKYQSEQKTVTSEQQLVWCIMSEKCLKLKVFAKIDFIAFFGFLRDQISLKYWDSIFPAPQPHFMTSFSKWPPLG